MLLDLNHFSTLVSSLVNSQELSFVIELKDTSSNTIDLFSYVDTSISYPIDCYYSINSPIYDTKCNNIFTNTKLDKGYRSEFKISSLSDYSTNTKLYFEMKYNLVLADLTTFESTIYNGLLNGTYSLEAYVLEASGV